MKFSTASYCLILVLFFSACKSKKETVVETKGEQMAVVVQEQKKDPVQTTNPEEEEEGNWKNNDGEPSGPKDWVMLDDLSTKGIGDHYELNKITQEGDLLLVNVSYSGGCKNHDFTLFAVRKGDSPDASLLLNHNGNNDHCEAWETETLRFRLSGIKEKIKGDEVHFSFVKKDQQFTYSIVR